MAVVREDSERCSCMSGAEFAVHTFILQYAVYFDGGVYTTCSLLLNLHAKTTGKASCSIHFTVPKSFSLYLPF